jgi:hypothetical protein
MSCHPEPLLRRILTFNGKVVVIETARSLRSTLCVTSFRMTGNGNWGTATPSLAGGRGVRELQFQISPSPDVLSSWTKWRILTIPRARFLTRSDTSVIRHCEQNARHCERSEAICSLFTSDQDKKPNADCPAPRNSPWGNIEKLSSSEEKFIKTPSQSSQRNQPAQFSGNIWTKQKHLEQVLFSSLDRTIDHQ